MIRKDFFAILFVAGIGGMVGGGIISYLMIPETVTAESNLDPIFQGLLERQKENQVQRNKHLNSLNLIQAEGFVLRDKDGKLRTILSTEPNGIPFLEMFDEMGRPSVRIDNDFISISRVDTGATVALHPERVQVSKGTSIAVLQVGERYSENQNASLSLANIKQNKFLSLNTEGAAIEIEQGENHRRNAFTLVMDEKGTNGQPSLEMKLAKFGGSSFLVRHLPPEGGNRNETMAVGIIDKEGEVIWTAP